MVTANKHEFKNKKNYFKVRTFYQKRRARHNNFTLKDVIKKFDGKFFCHLTGRPINIKKSHSYEFDHIVPRSKGGEDILDNLQLACKEANRAKHNMVLEDFIELCKEILEHQGYKVEKKN